VPLILVDIKDQRKPSSIVGRNETITCVCIGL